MRAPLLVAAIFVGAVIGTAVLIDRSPQNPAPPAPVPYAPATDDSAPAQPRNTDIGHLVLQIEGDANALGVTWITPKTSGYNKQRITSPYSVVLLGGRGDVLGSYPLDLAPFDLDPLRVGQPLKVTGCEVRDTRVATLHSVPYLDGLDSIQIRRGGRLLGRVAGVDLQRMIEEGSR